MRNEVARTGDEDRDRQAWEQRIASQMARLLIEATEERAGTEGDAEDSEEADGD